MKLNHAVTLYLKLREVNDSASWSGAQVLKHFTKQIGASRQLNSIQQEEVRTFLDGKGPLTRYWHRKHSALLVFFHFALARGFVSLIPLPVHSPKLRQTFQPYVYTTDEIRRLIEAAKNAQQARAQLDSPTLRMFLVLLYGTGLRLSEALHLKRTDVNLQEGLLTIRNSKFYKTRLVPIGPQLIRLLNGHIENCQVRPNPLPTSALLTYRNGRPLGACCVRRAFIRLRSKANIQGNHQSRYKPRLHDMRATFAVHRLTAWYRDGADVQKLLPLLSTYLGHTSIAATQAYLTMTPELLAQAANRFERYAETQEVHHD